METPTGMEEIKQRLRHEICLDCGGRSAAEAHLPDLPAECESWCPLFTKLPRLIRLVEQGEPPCGYEMFTGSLKPDSPALFGPDLIRALTVLETVIPAKNVGESKA